MRKSDFNTDTWSRLEKDLQAMREKLRDQLEGDMDPVQTATVRGRIRTIKELLALPDKAAPAKVLPPSEDGDSD